MPTKYNGTACKTCRRRGRKCTKEIPHCQSCINKGISCEGYTLRWAGLASRGRLAGKTTLDESAQVSNPSASSSPSQSTPSPPQQSNVLGAGNESHLIVARHRHRNDQNVPTNTIDANTEQSPSNTSPSSSGQSAETEPDFNFDFTAHDQFAEQEINRSIDISTSALPTIQTVFYTNPLDICNVPSELKFILDYHLREVAPKLCVDNESIKNPYSQYILPLAVQKPPLLYACAALAACHYSVRRSDQRFLIDCLKFRGKAMRRLQEFLWSEQSAKDEGNLGAVLMLTLTDICLGGHSNFDVHFKAAKRLIDLRGSEKTQDSFVEQYIAWLDIMSAATANRQPLFNSDDISTLTGPTQSWSHDVFPCPPDQFFVICEIVKLYKSQQDPSNPSAVTLSIAQAYKTRLLLQPMHIERGEPWLHLTEAYRHAIALYIIQLFGCSVDQDEIEWLAQSVFYHAKSTPILTGWADQLLWPLFHAGLEFRDDHRKTWLRERAQLMQASGGFGNVKTALTILERVWASDVPPSYTTLLSEYDFADLLLV